jgi:hypothetical protein
VVLPRVELYGVCAANWCSFPTLSATLLDFVYRCLCSLRVSYFHCFLLLVYGILPMCIGIFIYWFAFITPMMSVMVPYACAVFNMWLAYLT